MGADHITFIEFGTERVGFSVPFQKLRQAGTQSKNVITQLSLK